MQVAPTDYEISIISGSYGGHRQHKRHDGQSQGFDIGLSSLTRKPETLSKLSNQGPTMKKIYENVDFTAKNHENIGKNREDLKYREI